MRCHTGMSRVAPPAASSASRRFWAAIALPLNPVRKASTMAHAFVSTGSGMPWSRCSDTIFSVWAAKPA